jgi:hypothetical protein
MSQDLFLNIRFETTIPPSPGPDGEMFPFDIENVPHLRTAMVQKIEANIKQFGSVEKFVEQFHRELVEKFDVAETAVRTYEMRRIQMEFIKKWIQENSTVKDKNLDG